MCVYVHWTHGQLDRYSLYVWVILHISDRKKKKFSTNSSDIISSGLFFHTCSAQCTVHLLPHVFRQWACLFPPQGPVNFWVLYIRRHYRAHKALHDRKSLLRSNSEDSYHHPFSVIIWTFSIISFRPRSLSLTAFYYVVQIEFIHFFILTFILF